MTPWLVTNILSGSFRAMLAQAQVDELLTRDCFVRLKWPKAKRPEPDPLTADELRRVLAWFASHRFGFHPGRGTMQVRRYLHPAYHVYVHTLCWTGMRPSEASGLQWGDVDLRSGRIHVQRSRHLYEYGAPKTASAERWVELFPETVRLLRDLQPLHVTPDQPVFTTTTGTPIEPKTFSAHWYDCLRALGIRQRGLYATKDTFVRTALEAGVKIAWLEQQTGVAYATLRRHYGKWMPAEAGSELRRFAALDPGLFGAGPPRLSPGTTRTGDNRRKRAMKSRLQECEEGDLNPRALLKNLRILAAERAKTRKNGHEVDPGGPHLAGGDGDGAYDQANNWPALIGTTGS